LFLLISFCIYLQSLSDILPDKTISMHGFFFSISTSQIKFEMKTLIKLLFDGTLCHSFLSYIIIIKLLIILIIFMKKSHWKN
jgi:hypothetical protein